MTDADFTDWIRPHLGALTRLSRAFAAPSDQPDLLQELTIAVWKARPAFRGQSALSTFVYRVAHNRALTWKRRQGLWALRLFNHAADIAQVLSSQGSDVDQSRLDTVYDAIRRLPPLDRSLMLLSLEGVAHAEIAALHGLTVSNVGVRLTRARDRLSKELNHGL